ncbi:hypothetical protein MBLNU230_g1965t1 [Neophaeotheca triangularis]
MAASSPARTKALGSNMDVDYVVVFRFATTDKPKAAERFDKLLEALANVGLATEVRNGDNHALLVFCKVASELHFFGEIYRSRVQDWINGVRSAEPAKETKKSLEAEPLSQAERLRMIYQLITNPVKEGGAGITPKKGQWENVESVFALHDHNYNKAWIKKWSSQYLLKPEDLDEIRDRLGEKIAFYFAFTQSYFTFLLFPAALGLLSWLLLGGFSILFAIPASLWSVVFVEYWKHQEEDLAVRWNVKGVSNIENKRLEYRHEFETTDPVTGQKEQIFPATKRLQRQLLQIPFALAAAVVLGTLIAVCFAIEIFIREVYDGPFQFVLVYLPTIILTTFMPVLSSILTKAATKLSDYENYETESQYERSMTRKIFVLNFITSYLPIFLTAFVYLPFGALIVPYLDVFDLTVRPFADNEKEMETPDFYHFHIDPNRLRKQVIYFTVTAQLVSFAMEVIVPYLKRQGFIKYKQMQSERAAKAGGTRPDPGIEDAPEEKNFLTRVRGEAELDVYDVTTDFREMVIQFGYLSMFSVIWPLVPVSFLINNWVELRADAVKICVEMQRPTPWRADTIGPWLDSLSLLSWMGSLTMAALVYLFSNDGLGPDGSPYDIKAWGLLLSMFFGEHIYLLVRWIVSLAISKIDSPSKRKERREKFLVRQRYFEESLDQTSRLPPISEKAETINRTSLEEEARQGSLRTARSEEKFWLRQRNWRESAMVGKGLIERALPDEKESREDKKEL